MLVTLLTATGWLASVLLAGTATVLEAEDLLRDPAYLMPYTGARLAMALSYSTVGAVLMLQRRRNPIGWLLAAGGLGASFALFGAAYVDPAGARPLASLVALLTPRAFTPALLCAAVIVLLFPNGRLRRADRAILALLLAGAGLYATSALLAPGALNAATDLQNPLGVAGADEIMRVARFVGGRTLLLGLGLATLSYLLRYRWSWGDEKRQLTWLGLVAVLLAISLLVAFLHLGQASDVAWVVAFLAFSALPVAVWIAVVRYRLYDIDLIVARALVYMPLVGILGAVFTGSSLILQRFLAGLSDQGSDAAIVLSTLLAAALFTPLHKAITTRVDRLFETSGPDGHAAPQATRIGEGPDLETLERRMEEIARRVLLEALGGRDQAATIRAGQRPEPVPEGPDPTAPEAHEATS